VDRCNCGDYCRYRDYHRFGSFFVGFFLAFGLCGFGGVSSIRFTVSLNLSSSLVGFLGELAMPHSILGAKRVSPEILEKIGTVVSEWSWVEGLLGEMLAHFCSSDPGAMYVITQNVGNSTVTGWLRTLVQIKIKNPDSAKVIGDLLTEIDNTRAERNAVAHGNWWGGDDPKVGHVHSLNWERSEVAKEVVWHIDDFDDLIGQIEEIQLMVANLGVRLGFLRRE
jgi:hypothetical protein